MEGLKKLEALGLVKLVEGSDDYVGAVKELYNDVYGQWAEIKWQQKTARRVAREISTDFLTKAFGNGHNYTLVVTKNKAIGFYHCMNYFMDGSDDNIALLGLIGLYEELETKGEFKDSLAIMNFEA